MKSKLLKLDKPYNVIYAGGKVGKHIATLMVWNEVDDEDGVGIMDAVSYPVIDEGEEFPAGTLCDNVELHDCRVICSEIKKANIFWLAKIIEYDFRQIEPAGADYILERLKLLGTKIAMPTEKDEKTGKFVLKKPVNLELVAIQLNINPGYNEKLKKDCPEYWENEELDIGEEELS